LLRHTRRLPHHGCACDECDGLGTILEFDEELIIPDPTVSLGDGAIEAFRRNGKRMNIYYNRLLRQFCQTFNVSEDVPLEDLPAKSRDLLMHGTKVKDKAKYGASFEGVIPNLQRRWENTESVFVKERLHRYLSEQPCEKCKGDRLKPEALAVRIGPHNIRQITAMTIGIAIEFFRTVNFHGEQVLIAAPILKEIRSRLGFMNDVGLGYLTLDRQTGSLSGGEAQRIRLATQVGSGLVGVCYVLDEPTIGLHQRDNDRLIRTLRHLTDIGNTTIVVEHDEDTIRAADWLIDVGPGAGSHGGHIVAQGPVPEVLASHESITAKYLTGEYQIPLPAERHKVDLNRSLEVIGAAENNLRNINVSFPLGVMICVTGVSGSGKSSLVNHILLKALKRYLYGGKEHPGKHKKILGRSGDGCRFGGRAEHQRTEIRQPPSGAAQLAIAMRRHRVFDIIRTVEPRFERGAVVAREIGARHLPPPEDFGERLSQWILFGEKRHQHQCRQRGIGGEMREPGGDDRLGGFTIHQRRAEWRVGMRPADQNRQLHAVAARCDPRRKKAEKLARMRSRPDQDRTDVAAEHGGGGEREGRLIEDIGFKRARGKIAPLLSEGHEIGEPAPVNPAAARHRPRGIMRKNQCLRSLHHRSRQRQPVEMRDRQNAVRPRR